MAIEQDKLNAILHKAFPEADIQINDLAGDGDHYQLLIADKSFAGKSKIAQHKEVYKALNGKMGGELHALQIKTSIK